MKKEIEILREKLINELNKLENGIHIKLDLDPEIIELIIFKTSYSHNTTIDEFGNYCNEKKDFALPYKTLKKIDFSNTNARINPQNVYKKDLSNCIFKNNISPFTSFINVNTNNTIFLDNDYLENKIKKNKTK